MWQTLIIVLAVLLGSVVLIVLALIILLQIAKARLKRALTQLESSVKDLGDAFELLKQSMPPARIRLLPTLRPTWAWPVVVEAAAKDLHDAGFRDIGTYESAQMPGVNLRTLHDPARSIYALVFDAEKTGVTVMLFGTFDEGGSLTVTNAAEADGLPRPEDQPLILMPQASPNDMRTRFAEQQSGRSLAATSADAFPITFESDHARLMDWRFAHGFGLGEELRTMTETPGQPLDEATAELAKVMMSQYASDQIGLIVREKYAEQAGVPMDERDRLEEELLIIHDRMERDDLLAAIEDLGADVEAAEGVPTDGNAPARELFRRMNDLLPSDERFECVGEFAAPVPADVYRLPESLHSAEHIDREVEEET